MRLTDRPAVPRRIVGFEQDAERHWVAALECGHGQHVRHEPPLQSRPWVTDEAGRAERIGTRLWCVRCADGEPAPAPPAYEDVRRLAHLLPGVEDGTSYGTPALKAGGKLVARLREDDATLVLRAGFVVRDHLVHARPDVYFLTDHYRDHPYVLVRIAAADRLELAALLEEAWRQVAPKRAVAAWDARRDDA